MLRKVQVYNYKSIPNLTLDLCRVTVLIGANGSGKSNILEAIALASAATQNKLDNETLMKLRDNPSLKLFIEQLDALRSWLYANNSGDSQKHENAEHHKETPPDA